MQESKTNAVETEGRQELTQEMCGTYRPEKEYTWRQEGIDNLPYLVMTILGAAILWMGAESTVWKWIGAAGYIFYSIAGAFCIILLVCPYCHLYDTRRCPCGYGHIAARLRPRKDMSLFKQKFKRHILIIVPLWFIPLLVGGLGLYREFRWLLAGLLVGFMVVSFIILPLVARIYGCGHCSQKEKCPWMK
jgi:hypothetical protein